MDANPYEPPQASLEPSPASVSVDAIETLQAGIRWMWGILGGVLVFAVALVVGASIRLASDLPAAESPEAAGEVVGAFVARLMLLAILGIPLRRLWKLLGAARGVAREPRGAQPALDQLVLETGRFWRGVGVFGACLLVLIAAVGLGWIWSLRR